MKACSCSLPLNDVRAARSNHLSTRLGYFLLVPESWTLSSSSSSYRRSSEGTAADKSNNCSVRPPGLAFAAGLGLGGDMARGCKARVVGAVEAPRCANGTTGALTEAERAPGLLLGGGDLVAARPGAAVLGLLGGSSADESRANDDDIDCPEPVPCPCEDAGTAGAGGRCGGNGVATDIFLNFRQ